MSDVTEILRSIEKGDSQAAEELLPIVYQELRRLAASKMRGEREAHTLEPTALVHEAYLRLVDQQQPQHWQSRQHFFGAAAEAMRRILIERARQRQSQKRGGELKRQPLDSGTMATPESSTDLLALDEALTRLEQHDAQAAQLVKLRYFSGLTNVQAAELLDLSPRSADRLWAYAKAWLYRELS
jgi:RNA polymerase sigma factor (TIGR02999 family)